MARREKKERKRGKKGLGSEMAEESLNYLISPLKFLKAHTHTSRLDPARECQNGQGKKGSRIAVATMVDVSGGMTVGLVHLVGGGGGAM